MIGRPEARESQTPWGRSVAVRRPRSTSVRRRFGGPQQDQEAWRKRHRDARICAFWLYVFGAVFIVGFGVLGLVQLLAPKAEATIVTWQCPGGLSNGECIATVRFQADGKTIVTTVGMLGEREIDRGRFILYYNPDNPYDEPMSHVPWWLIGGFTIAGAAVIGGAVYYHRLRLQMSRAGMPSSLPETIAPQIAPKDEPENQAAERTFGSVAGNWLFLAFAGGMLALFWSDDALYKRVGLSVLAVIALGDAIHETWRLVRARRPVGASFRNR